MVINVVIVDKLWWWWWGRQRQWQKSQLCLLWLWWGLNGKFNWEGGGELAINVATEKMMMSWHDWQGWWWCNSVTDVNLTSWWVYQWFSDTWKCENSCCHVDNLDCFFSLNITIKEVIVQGNYCECNCKFNNSITVLSASCPSSADRWG